jgi:hypothetical protein
MSAMKKLTPSVEPSNNPSPKLFDNYKRKRRHGPCEVVPFPVTRRRHFLRNIDIKAFDLFENDAEAHDEYFHEVIGRHKQRLERLGIAPHRVAADVQALEDHFFSFDNAALRATIAAVRPSETSGAA